MNFTQNVLFRVPLLNERAVKRKTEEYVLVAEDPHMWQPA